ncbi:jouberin-like isoform X2 [Ruditapes philippinarum]|uniref:jouberin-like isoform X2 n=1 Tax=Ruditapes philippinarum TaxID=129788 RepID=UPI00295AE244|nr:jouberin-like isoform X2 [Ruditapes philippinarum]
MADEGALVERPKKTKRPKSGKKMEDIPMSTMDGGSNKFNQLLQQAVGQSLSEAKVEKKKKKKKGDDSVLESLRKGEGLQKDVDETKLANTFDPDDTKYKKSNKQKQKIIEERNRQNELEIVDENKGKTKKKKKQKTKDELIENFDESQIEPPDKTMTMSELETSTQKTPGKKKKKKQEEEPVLSARSEDEPSVATTPKKKPRKKVPRDGTPEPDSQTDTVLTPTKKKKKKPAADTEDEAVMSPSEEVVSPKGKKKKKRTEGETDEEGVLSPSEEPTSPKGKKGKKKKKEGETDEEAALSPAEEPLSPKDGKKKKKKRKTEEEAVLSAAEEPLSPKDGKKKKKKKGEGETEDEALSPGEEVESPRVKGKKKKKKKDKGEEEGEKEDEEEKEEEAPVPKERKKKKKKGTEEAETVEEEEAGPSGMEAEDEGRILAVTIHRTDKLKNDFYIMHPMVRVHIVDELTGKYLPKQHKDRAVTSYYETKNDNVKHILPIMTKPFDFKQNKSVLPVWEELLVFNENFNYFILDRPKVLLVFELLDFVSMNKAAQTDSGWHRIGWAFLKVLGNNNKLNCGSKVRLQIFEAPPSNLRRKADMEEAFQWWKECPRKPYPSTLYVTLKGIRPPLEVEAVERSLFATQEERGRMTFEELKKTVKWTGGKKEPQHKTLSSWSRLAGQFCRLPNVLSHSLPSAKKGCYMLKFSHDGRSLACACQGKDGYPILVYEIPSGTLKGKFLGHFGIVYDLSWSKLDTHLLSASSDGTARVWDIQAFGENQQKLLPHPAFVYCSQFHSRVETVAVTGGFDQVIRVWDVSDDDHKVDLRQELDHHVGLVNSICFSEDGQKMYSADSVGVIIIWNSFVTEMPSKRGVARDWTLFAKIEDADMKGTAINHIVLHPRERRLLVHCRDNILRMFDLRIQRVMQKYIGALNFREQIRSDITPCGSFVFSGSEDNYAYVWNTDTGDQVLMYSELNYQNPVTDVCYHPRDHMVAFCSLGENHPILIYSYDPAIAQFEAGLSPRMISPVPADDEERLGRTSTLQEELATKGVLTKEEFELHNTNRYDKVMKTLNKVTAQMTSTPTLDLPGMAAMSPRSTMMTMGSTGYDMYGTTPRSMTGSPTMFSPHAPRSMSSVMQHQQFASQNMYMKGVDSWRPTFSEVGRHGRSTSPVQFGRTPQLNMTASQQGKAQFNFQAAPGKSRGKQEKVYVLYDYKAQRSDELDIFAGDEILVLYKDTENWWMGELSDGRQGFFPSNYVTQDDTLLDSHRTGMTTPDDSDSESKNLTAVRTKSGELKFVSGGESSGDDMLESSRARRRKKRNSQDSGTLSGGSQTSGGVNSKKPPRKAGQKVRIDETNNESMA